MNETASTEPPLRPIIFGQLCLLERISVGGMAEVFRARPFNAPEFDRVLAVKRILPSLEEDEEFLQMFIDEAKIAMQLSHTNIAQNYELGRRGQSHYIVMEYVAGHELLRLQNELRRRRRIMAPQMAAYIVRGIARALDHAHRLTDEDGNATPIIHRDVSPQNILVSWGGEVKLIDFGIAKVANRSSKTQVGVLKGKFSYMSPEQVLGKVMDTRADLFSLGIVLHELLTGRRLFAADSDFDTLEKVKDAKVEPPSSLNDKVPWQLDNITLKALAREPKRRYTTGEDLAAALTEYLDSLETPFDRDAMSDWMVESFPKDLARERERRDLYAKFVHPDDVIAHNDRLIDELRASLGAPEREEDEVLPEDVEVTQVVDEDYKRLMGELDDSELEKGQQDQVLARSALGSLTKLLAEKSDAMLASIDLPEPNAHVEPPAEVFLPPRRRRPRRTAIAALFVVGLLAAAGAAYLGSMERRGDSGASTGMAVLDVVPPDELQIFWDGRLTSREAPLVLSDQAVGEHELEIRRDDFETYRDRIAIDPGRATRLTVALVPLPSEAGQLALEVDPPDAQLWLNGAAIEGAGRRRQLTVAARLPHRIEVWQAGYLPFEETLSFGPGQRRELGVVLVRAEGRVVLNSEPAGTVVIDGEPRGSSRGGLVVEGLDVRLPHSLRIDPAEPGFRAYETTLLFDGVREINLFATLPRIGDGTPVEDVEVGYLTVDTGERWFRLQIDGRVTGLTTPISEEAPLALRAGVREVRLVRGDEQHGLTIEIVADTTLRIDCRTPSEQCGI